MKKTDETMIGKFVPPEPKHFKGYPLLSIELTIPADPLVAESMCLTTTTWCVGLQGATKIKTINLWKKQHKTLAALISRVDQVSPPEKVRPPKTERVLREGMTKCEMHDHLPFTPLPFSYG